MTRSPRTVPFMKSVVAQKLSEIRKRGVLLTYCTGAQNVLNNFFSFSEGPAEDNQMLKSPELIGHSNLYLYHVSIILLQFLPVFRIQIRRNLHLFEDPDPRESPSFWASRSSWICIILRIRIRMNLRHFEDPDPHESASFWGPGSSWIPINLMI